MEFTSSYFFLPLKGETAFTGEESYGVSEQKIQPLQQEQKKTMTSEEKKGFLLSIYFLNSILEKAFILAIPPCMGGAPGEDTFCFPLEE